MIQLHLLFLSLDSFSYRTSYQHTHSPVLVSFRPVWA